MVETMASPRGWIVTVDRPTIQNVAYSTTGSSRRWRRMSVCGDVVREEEGRAWCCGIVDLAWSEEEVAVHREGPSWVRFFVTGVLSFRFVPDSVGFCGSRVFPTALAGEGLVIPTGPCSRGSPPYFVQLGARRRESSVSDGLQRRLWCRGLSAAVRASIVFGSMGGGATLGVPGEGSERSGRYSVRLPCMIRARVVGCSCCCAACVASVVTRHVRAVAAWLALDSLAVVFLVWRTLASQSNLLFVHASAQSTLSFELSSSVEVLPKFFSVGSGGSENGALVVLVEVLPGLACVASAVLLAVVFSLMVRIIWIVHSGEGSSQDRPLSLLAELLHWPACLVVHFQVFSAALVGLRVPMAYMVCFVSRALRALLDGGLVSVVVLGWLCFVWKFVIEVVLLALAHQRVAAGLGPTWPVAIFQACGSWNVAFGSPIGGTSGFGRDLCPVWKPMAESLFGSSGDSEVYRLASTRPCGLSTLGGVRLWLDLKRLLCFRR
ncbi:hypothetical protein Taro_018672, partial [Colocasia esculenta]|nr:hypothetical protein [Colocasia esculenta]